MSKAGKIKKPRFTIGIRLTIIISSVSIVFLSVVGVLLVNFLEDNLLAQKKNNFQEFADFIARSSAFHIENTSYYMLDQNSISLQSVEDKNGIDILSIIIYGKDGQKLNPSGIPHSKIMVPPKYWLTIKRKCYYTPRQEPRREVGNVVLVFSLARVYGKIDSLKTSIIGGIIGAVILLNLIIYWLVTSSIAKRLRRLRRVVDRMGEDDDTWDVGASTRDEVGEIVQAYNQTTAAIKERSRRFEYRNRELEKLQAESKRKNQDLEITLKKQARELEKARTAADFAGKIKTQFLSNMSHEIRTPLSGIMGMTNLLDDTELSPKQQEYLKHLKKSGLLLTNIVGDILDISRIESGRWRLEEKPFDLSVMIEDCLVLLNEAAAEKQLDTQWNIEPETPVSLIGDEKSTSQILVNIVSNAIKFTEQGHIDIAVKQIARQNENAFIAFIVSDTGIGIPEERIDDIFEQFTQLDSSFTKQYSGTGLGLTIVKSLVEMLSGKIRVDSEPGKGTTFTVELPFKVAIGVQQEIKIPKLNPEPVEMDDTKTNHRILIAEDNEINLFFLESFLSKNGYTVHGVSNGQAVLDKLEANSYDLIIMDMKMPVMSGIKCTKLLREMEKKSGKHNKIIALTGLTMIEDRDRIEQAGVDYIISKPVNEAALLKKIKEILG